MEVVAQSNRQVQMLMPMCLYVPFCCGGTQASSPSHTAVQFPDVALARRDPLNLDRYKVDCAIDGIYFIPDFISEEEVWLLAHRHAPQHDTSDTPCVPLGTRPDAIGVL